MKINYGCVFISIKLMFVQMVMEFMDGGSLTQVLDQYKYLKLTEEQIALIMGEVIHIWLVLNLIGTCWSGLFTSNASYS